MAAEIKRLGKVQHRFEVSADAISNPASFEETLQVEALVEVRSAEDAAVTYCYNLDVLNVRIVGLRAWLPSLEWAEVLVQPNAEQSDFVCPEDFYP